MKNSTNKKVVSSSFRDPTGFLFTKNGTLFRQINPSGFEDYFHLINSDLYDELTENGMLIPHEEISPYDQDSPPDHVVIKPEVVGFISYPYEWSFSQLKAAAQTTLEIQKIALQKGMSLKDCSAYNIQFYLGKPTLIDTLSFERYREGEPWTAYRQFCQHFLAPLALMAYTDVRLSQLLRVYIDGIPLDLTSKLLPKKTSLNFAINVHIHIHAKSQARFSEKEIDRDKGGRQIKEHQLLGLVESLNSGIKKLDWTPEQTDWAEYEKFHNYTPEGLQHKEDLVSQYLSQSKASIVWDMGANVGMFSRISSQQKKFTIALDLDPGAVELNYLRAFEEGDRFLLPLLTDLTNPSPGLGWSHKERQSLLERGPADAVLALALIHHLAIGNNVPLEKLAEFFSQICKWLIIEFVPKHDPQVERLLRVRQDIFPNYNRDHFQGEFGKYFELLAQQRIKDSERDLFLYKLKNNLSQT
jgi:hypothetical protein